MSIKIAGVSKKYKKGKLALDNVNLEVGKGMFGLLGPNGAGKSTLIRILASLDEPTSGRVEINGLDVVGKRQEVRKMLGYLPQDFRFVPPVSTWDFLDYCLTLSSGLKKKERNALIEEMLREVALYEVRKKRADKLSGGMKRRLGIAQALIHQPSIIIVDEPTTGLDPDERIRFRNLITKVCQKEVTVLLSTHIVGDISSTCTDLAILNQGHIEFQGSPKDMTALAAGHVWRMDVGMEGLEEIKHKYQVISTMPMENGWQVEVVAEELDGHTGEFIPPNLEHAYVYFMECRERIAV